MPGNAVEICNMALANIGQGSIQSLTQKNKSAVICKARYDEARVEALSSQMWNFAKKWADGVKVNAAAMPGWSYVHKYPNDALFVNIWQELPAGPPVPFEVSMALTGGGKWIHSNLEEPKFIYTTDIEDVVLFDAHFATALSWLLAAKIAMPLTKSKKVEEDAYRKWGTTLSTAAVKTKSEQQTNRDQLSSYHSVR